MADGDGTQSGAAGLDPNAGGAGSEGQGNSGPNGHNNSGAQSGAEGSPPATGATVSAEEHEAVRKRMVAADRRASDLEEKAKQAEREKLDETERAKSDLKDKTEALEKATETIQTLSLDLAFFKDNTYDWKNPATARRLLDMNGVTIGEDGAVQGLKTALDKLAKDEPYMLKTSDDGAESGAGGRTGPPMNNGRTAGNSQAQKEAKFPALRGRVLRND